jgi:hypothetical protein
MFLSYLGAKRERGERVIVIFKMMSSYLISAATVFSATVCEVFALYRRGEKERERERGERRATKRKEEEENFGSFIIVVMKLDF